MLTALAGWHTAAVLLARSPEERAQQEAAAALAQVPEELRLGPEQDESTRWIADPTRLLRVCDAAVRRLVALPAGTPSLRLLADQTAGVLGGISHALNGLALLVADPARPVPRSRGSRRLRIADWLPPLVNAGRALVVIGAAELFWIVTAWPNGAGAITFAAIGVILFAPRADHAYATAIGFMIGTSLTAALAAIIAFAVLPNLETFAAFSLAIGLVLVPAGALMAQPWQTAIFTAMAANPTSRIGAIFCFRPVEHQRVGLKSLHYGRGWRGWSAVVIFGGGWGGSWSLSWLIRSWSSGSGWV